MIPSTPSQCFDIMSHFLQPFVRLLPEDLDYDDRRKRLMAAIGLFILIPIMIYFITVDIKDGMRTSMYMDSGLAILFIVGLWRLMKMQKAKAMYRILIAGFSVHCCSDSFFAPAGDSSLIWLLIYPPVVFFMLSVPEGLYWFIVMFATNFIIITFKLFPAIELYSDYMRIRIFIALIIIAFFTFSFELLRWRFYTQLKKRNNELNAAIKKVHTLQGLLPMCSICKSIRDDKGYWKMLEEYLSDHTEAILTHGICDTCMKEYYPDVYENCLKTNKHKELSIKMTLKT